MTTVRFRIEWRDASPRVDDGAIPIWDLSPLAHEDFTAALSDGFERAADPDFTLHWAGVEMRLSSLNDLAYMANDLIDLGWWLCSPKGDLKFSLSEQGFQMQAVAVMRGSEVDLSATWEEAYRTPIASLANHPTVQRADLAREVGTLLGQLEQMLLTQKQVYVPLTWVCRHLSTS